jgi:hypothetical protein
MERIPNRLKISALILLPALLLTVAHAGTRFLPPPPSAQSGENFATEESYFGNTHGRFRALEDDEGREIDVADHLSESDQRMTARQFYSTTAAAQSEKKSGRSPAGLEVGGQPTRQIEVKTLNRPSMKRMPSSRELSSEIARQEVKTEEFVTDLNDPVSRRKGVQEVALIASDLGFFPKTFFVSRDVPVRLFVTGATKGSLCLMMDSFNVRKQVRGGKIEEITFTPNQPGTYRYYCPVNGSEGVMVVKELSTAISQNE